MPKINVYLPDDLAAAVRETGIPVSAVCQRALADAVAATDGTIGETPSQAAGDAHETDWLHNRLTDRARRVIEMATEYDAKDEPVVSSVHLLAALVSHGNNLALVVLRSLEVEPDDLMSELRAAALTGKRANGESSAAPLAEIRERATEAAHDLGTNFIGCEHLLLAILAGPDSDPAVITLNTLGLTLPATRNAVRTALNGYTYAQGNLSLSSLSAPIRSVLEEIRQRLGRLEQN